MDAGATKDWQPADDDHSPKADDEFEIDPSLAASMGFSSFGNGTRKRKHNSDNAVTDASPLSGQIKRPQGAPSGRGANITPLGNRRGPSAPGQELVSDGKRDFDLPRGDPPPVGAALRTALEKPATTGQDQMPFTQNTPDLGAYRHGVRQPNGDIAYFLPSFIEDPWAQLKKK